MASPYEGYVNVVDFGARPNSFLDDTEAFLKALSTGKSVFVPDGIFYIKRTLVLENQNLVGCGSMQTHIVSTTNERNVPIVMAGRTCTIKDMLLMFEHILGDESEGERVGILVHGKTWPLQRGSIISNLHIKNCGTALYMPRYGLGGGPGPFNVEHSNLEIGDFTFRAIDYGARHRVGNIFTNLFISNPTITAPVDTIIRFDGDSNNVSMSHITIIDTVCKKAALSFNCVRGFHVSTVHIGNVGIAENGHAFVELDNSSGEFGAINFTYIPLDCKESSLIKLYNSYYDMYIGDKERQLTNHYLKIGNLDVKCINDPTRTPRYPDRVNDGLVEPYDKCFKFITRDKDGVGTYSVDIANYIYYTFKNDRIAYEKFECDDDRINFVCKGMLPKGGPTSMRPQFRLCKFTTEYFDTDIGKKICWDGEKWV